MKNKMCIACDSESMPYFYSDKISVYRAMQDSRNLCKKGDWIFMYSEVDSILIVKNIPDGLFENNKKKIGKHTFESLVTFFSSEFDRGKILLLPEFNFVSNNVTFMIKGYNEFLSYSKELLDACGKPLDVENRANLFEEEEWTIIRIISHVFNELHLRRKDLKESFDFIDMHQDDTEKKLLILEKDDFHETYHYIYQAGNSAKSIDSLVDDALLYEEWIKKLAPDILAFQDLEFYKEHEQSVVSAARQIILKDLQIIIDKLISLDLVKYISDNHVALYDISYRDITL